MKKTSSTDSFQKNSVIQLWKASRTSRKAFAAAERTVHKNVGRRSSSKDFLKSVTSLIKEKEDAWLKPGGKIFK